MRTIKISTLVLFGIYLLSCTNQEPEKPKTAEELRAELKLQEEQSPLQYLTDTAVVLEPQKKKVREAGFFRDAEYAPDGAILKGVFINKASIAKFKDIVAKVSFYSKTKTLVKEESYVFYEYYEPNSTKEFAVKVKILPDTYESFGFEIVDAKPVYE